jgi:hypothetical protein
MPYQMLPSQNMLLTHTVPPGPDAGCQFDASKKRAPAKKQWNQGTLECPTSISAW